MIHPFLIMQNNLCITSKNFVDHQIFFVKRPRVSQKNWYHLHITKKCVSPAYHQKKMRIACVSQKNVYHLCITKKCVSPVLEVVMHIFLMSVPEAQQNGQVLRCPPPPPNRRCCCCRGQCSRWCTAAVTSSASSATRCASSSWWSCTTSPAAWPLPPPSVVPCPCPRVVGIWGSSLRACHRGDGRAIWLTPSVNRIEGCL